MVFNGFFAVFYEKLVILPFFLPQLIFPPDMWIPPAVGLYFTPVYAIIL